MDGEGSFTVSISKDDRCKVGWQVRYSFKIKLHKRDLELLKRIKSYFNEVGIVGVYGDLAYYHVSSKNEIIKVIIPHFDKYPLITQKQKDFLLFKQIMELVNKDEHLNSEGFNKVINLKTSLKDFQIK